ncbi:MAG: hypothetical protein ACP5TY_04250, partial [Thermodesulforhabdaceae bacterium]
RTKRDCFVASLLAMTSVYVIVSLSKAAVAIRPEFVIARPRSGRGNLMGVKKRDCFASLAMTEGRTKRDCFVASLLAMTSVYVIVSLSKAGVVIFYWEFNFDLAGFRI